MKSDQSLAQVTNEEGHDFMDIVDNTVKDQGACNSCYAFAMIGALEARMRLKGINYNVDLSEQTIINCDTVSNGCTSGNTRYVAQYLAANA